MDSQQFKNLLNTRGLKATNHRLNLLTAIDEYQSAMPYSVLQEEMKSMDRVTLYRTIESLKDRGVIHMAFQEHSETFYAICDQKCDRAQHQHDHIHFKCNECGSVTCERPRKKVEIAVADLEIHKISIHVEGLCRACLT